MKTNQVLVIIGACLVSIALRTIDTPIANFSSVVALSLLCGSVIRHRAAFLIPLGIRLITDLLIHFKTGYGFFDSWPFDYTAYVVICLLGTHVNARRALPVAMGTVASVAIYFLLSNFGVWLLQSEMYPNTIGGLVACFVKAVPFVRGTVVGNLIFAPLFFAAWNLVAVPGSATEKMITAEE